MQLFTSALEFFYAFGRISNAINGPINENNLAIWSHWAGRWYWLSSDLTSKTNWRVGRGVGQVVSLLAFYSNDLSSNPAEVYNFFCTIDIEKNENKQKEAHLKKQIDRSRVITNLSVGVV